MTNRPAPHFGSGRLFREGLVDVWPAGAAAFLGAAMVAVAVLAPDGVTGWMGVAAAAALGTWWGSNTIAHIHLHRPLFAGRRANRAFALYLTVVLGVPQSIWRARHLWHHAGERAAEKPGLARGALVEIALVAAAWLALAIARPWLLLLGWLPGWGLAMALCQLQGVYEHAGVGPSGISVYGRLYNLLWFNDGYHVEHHARPDAHWRELPSLRRPGAPRSRLPPVLRWLPRALDRASPRRA